MRKLDHCEGRAESFVKDARVGSAMPDVVEDEEGYLYSFGYRCLGPVLVGFCQWLREQLRRDDVDKLFFLSRDGLIVKKTMGKLGMAESDGVYLYASRRAFQVPSFALVHSLAEILDAMFLPREVSLRELFEKTGLDGCSAAKRMESLGIDPDRERPSASLSADEEALRAYEALSSDIYQNATAELELLREYLVQESFEGRVGIVDIGWFGNMQVALERVCQGTGINAEIHGYYVGLAPTGTHQLKHLMSGYLFDANHGQKLFRQERCYSLLFETFFSALHGTTVGYKRAGNRVEPVLARYAGVEAAIGAKAELGREGALLFASRWARAFGQSDMDIAPECTLSEFSRVGVSPTAAEADYFGDWAMESDGAIVFAAKPGKLSTYIKYPQKFLRDFSHASWKIGFLKRLIRLPFPYGPAWIAVHAIYQKVIRPDRQ